MRRKGDKRFDLVLSAEERATLDRLAGPEGAQNFVKRLVNREIKRRGLRCPPLMLRGQGRHARASIVTEPRVAIQVITEPAARRRLLDEIEFGPGYFRRAGG